MARGAVEVVGLSRLRRTMRAAGLDVAELKSLNRAAAEVVEPVARSTAPIGPPEGGHLRDTVRVGASGSAGVIRVGSARRPYAGPIHWGWPGRNIKANTWVYDAAKSTEPRWIGKYQQGIESILDKIQGA